MAKMGRPRVLDSRIKVCIGLERSDYERLKELGVPYRDVLLRGIKQIQGE